ncbi:hypothetical protein BXY64_3066 [Marinifilum flexuosum]|uniref:Uncharacterized protein n=1 Tax=Marinifilum flexuosum TaxID=1117708 RepID=A0A419WX88_9BACT|nr:hypothetical protein BXY64_3066 [Marinifilum flexuosum]
MNIKFFYDKALSLSNFIKKRDCLFGNETASFVDEI